MTFVTQTRPAVLRADLPLIAGDHIRACCLVVCQAGCCCGGGSGGAPLISTVRGRGYRLEKLERFSGIQTQE